MSRLPELAWLCASVVPVRCAQQQHMGVQQAHGLTLGRALALALSICVCWEARKPPQPSRSHHVTVMQPSCSHHAASGCASTTALLASTVPCHLLVICEPSPTGKEDAAAITKQVDDASAGLRLLYVTPEKIVNSKRFFAKASCGRLHVRHT